VLIAPAASARLVARRMGPMLACAAAIAVVAGAGGLYLSYYAGTAAGASIAGVLVGAFLLAGAARAASRYGTWPTATRRVSVRSGPPAKSP
jgi:ABC-type Mn2+/Zn2+ transport system permease subunit